MPNLLFHLQFPPPEMAVGIVHNILFDALDNFEQTTSPDGTITLTNGVVSLNTGNFALGLAMLRRYLDHPTEKYNWEKKRTFKIRVFATIHDDDNPFVYIGCGGDAIGLEGMGFKYYKDKLVGYWSDGTAPYEVDLITGLTPPWSMIYDLKLIFSPGENIKFYVDDVDLATVTEHLPSGDNYAHFIFNAAVQNNADELHDLSFCQLRLDQDL